MNGMANKAKGGALRAKRTQRGRRANASWPALADDDQSDFDMVCCGIEASCEGDEGGDT